MKRLSTVLIIVLALAGCAMFQITPEMRAKLDGCAGKTGTLKKHVSMGFLNGKVINTINLPELCLESLDEAGKCDIAGSIQDGDIPEGTKIKVTNVLIVGMGVNMLCETIEPTPRNFSIVLNAPAFLGSQGFQMRDFDEQLGWVVQFEE